MIQRLEGDEVASEAYYSSPTTRRDRDRQCSRGRRSPALAEDAEILASIDSLKFDAEGQKISLDDETLRELKALGYID